MVFYFYFPKKWGGEIFNGYFSVNNDTNLVTQFYDSTNPSVNIYVNNGYDYEDSLFYTTPYNSFSDGGTNITSLPYFNNLYPNAAYYALWNGNYSASPADCYVDILNSGGGTIHDSISVNMDFTSIPDPSCFNEGTKILSLTKNLEEKYVPIESLKKGDIVKTYKHGYRKIELIGKGTLCNNPNSEKFNECMYKMAKTDTNGLTEDLIVTEGHSILVDDLGDAMKQNRRILGGLHKIDDKFLLLAAVSKDFVKLEGNDTYTYYHLALENDGNDDARYGIWANGGVLTETVSVNQFNERKYTLL